MSLDLQEQEQIDELKHFWQKYGNLITGLLIALLLAYAGWNGWQWWQRSQAAKASLIYDELGRAVTAKDVARIDRAFADIRQQFGSTAYAEMSSLLVAKANVDAGKLDAAQAALAWGADHAKDDDYRSMARLRLAALQRDRKALDDALKTLSQPVAASFAPLASDVRADVLAAQGKRDEARAEYKKAYDGLDSKTAYRQIIELKMSALGGGQS